MSVGRTECTHCGKVWANGEAYLQDKVKCGKEDCTQLSAKENNVGMDSYKNWPFNRRKKEVEIKVSTGTVPDKVGQKDDEVQYFEEVPKVIVTSMRMK